MKHPPTHPSTGSRAGGLAVAFSAAADVERRMLAGLSARDQEKLRDLIFRCVTQITEERGARELMATAIADRHFRIA